MDRHLTVTLASGGVVKNWEHNLAMMYHTHTVHPNFTDTRRADSVIKPAPLSVLSPSTFDWLQRESFFDPPSIRKIVILSAVTLISELLPARLKNSYQNTSTTKGWGNCQSIAAGLQQTSLLRRFFSLSIHLLGLSRRSASPLLFLLSLHDPFPDRTSCTLLCVGDGHCKAFYQPFQSLCDIFHWLLL